MNSESRFVYDKTLAKSLLKLAKEFQVQLYGSLIGHTTIVFTRFIVLSWQHRNEADPRTVGGLFYELCDDLDWACVLQELIGFLEDTLRKTNQKPDPKEISVLDKRVAWLYQGLFADFNLRKLSE